ncbi:MAG: helix-turn-helix domain-containing protein [Caldimonas sp.]
MVCERGDTLRYAHFPTDSFVSLVSVIDGSPGVKVGMIGSEGVVGAQLALGIATAPLLGLVQGAGPAWRIKSVDLRRLLTKSESLRVALDRYLYVLMLQLATSAACLRFHEIGPRLVRWLLMSQDRAHSDQFQVTQEFLAYMLGVRRVGITTAAGALQRQKLISYHRGEVTIVDRKGLEAAACGSYADDSVASSAVMR